MAMNTLPAYLKSIEYDENLSLVSLDTPIGTLWVLLLATQDMRQDMSVGAELCAIFKPTQVLLTAQNPAPYVQNCFASRITHIQKDTILSLVSLEGGIDALVPTRGIDNLGEGDRCFWYVNPSDVLLES